MNEAGLDATQLENLRTSLEGLRDELEQQREKVRAETAPVAPDDAIGRLTRMDAMQQREMALASAEAATRRLHAVLRALDRIEDPEFGLCTRCEEAIEWPRLRARPEASLCLGCQGAREQPR